MDSDQINNTFGLIGPTYLTTVNWENPSHRRVVMASLVKGVYVSELDRREECTDSDDALAPLWWESFHFRFMEALKDGSSIFGHVYELNSPAASSNSSNAPKYVVAFRGTIKKRQSLHSAARDVRVNLSLISSSLNKRSRFKSALETINNMVKLAESADKVWIAGHSQGAAIAMLAGKVMMKDSCISITAYIFNPPFISSSALTSKIKVDQRIKDKLQRKSDIAKATLTHLTKSPSQVSKEHDEFSKLVPWVPNLFVHSSDLLCSRYITYFEKMRDQREMDEFWKVAFKTSLLNTFRGLFSELFWKGSTLPIHIIPSASLTVIRKECSSKEAHALRQWWHPDIHLDEQQGELYQYKEAINIPP